MTQDSQKSKRRSNLSEAKEEEEDLNDGWNAGVRIQNG